MELRQIRYFITVAETSSLTHAVDRLHIAQPALSLNIKNLEDELGVQLFNRSRRGMELTDPGRVFLEHAYAIMKQVNRARESVQETAENPRGSVSVAMSASVTNVLSVPVYQLLEERYPHIELNLEEGLTGNLMQAFEIGMYDLMIDFDAEKSETIEVNPLIREDLYLITRYSRERARETRIPFKSLVKFPLIVPKAQHAMGRTVQKYAQQQGIELIIVHGTSALHPMLKLVEAGIGSSILPWSAIHELADQKRICALQIVEPTMHRTASIIYPTNRPQSQAAHKVVEIIRDAVRQVFAEEKWRGELLMSPEV